MKPFTKCLGLQNGTWSEVTFYGYTEDGAAICRREGEWYDEFELVKYDESTVERVARSLKNIDEINICDSVASIIARKVIQDGLLKW